MLVEEGPKRNRSVRRCRPRPLDTLPPPSPRTAVLMEDRKCSLDMEGGSGEVDNGQREPRRRRT